MQSQSLERHNINLALFKTYLLLNWISWDSEGVIFPEGLKGLSLTEEKGYRGKRKGIASNPEGRQLEGVGRGIEIGREV